MHSSISNVGNHHKHVKLTYQQKTISVRLSTKIDTALNKITKKIKSRFKLNIDQHVLSFNHILIELDDAETLQRVLLNHKSEISFIVAKKTITVQAQTQLQQD
eukprot:72990_1